MNDTDPLVLVTGAAGFVGRYLVEHLAADGREVVAWTRTPPPADPAGTVRWQRLDLLDRAAVCAAVRALRPGIVYHCAGASRAAASWHDSASLLEGNVLATSCLLDALRRAGDPCRVLVPGSALVYAPADRPLCEEDPVAPAGPYALSKLAQEELARRLAGEAGLEIVLTRSFNHTGPRQSPAFVAPALARQIALIEHGAAPPRIQVGNLDAVRDLSDVRDVVRAYRALMTSGTSSTIYNVASGTGRSIRSLLEVLLAKARRPVQVVTDPARLREHDVSRLVGNPARLQAATGWQPLVPFEQTLDDLLEYWRAAVLRAGDRA